MNTGHAKLSPSSAHRWVPCTASVGYIEELGLTSTSSIYADEGTDAHALAVPLLNQSAPPPADPEMLAYVRGYVEWVQFFVKKATKQTLWVERRVSLFYSPEDYGTSDAVVWGKNFIFIGDLKYGAGVSVEAVGNKQLAIYAESVVREIEEIFEVRPDMPVILGIYQPRDRNNPEPSRLWELTRRELGEFCMEIANAARTIAEFPEKTRFVADPDRQCRFCPAKSGCRTYASYGLSAIPVEVDSPVIELPNPNTIPREQRQKILQAKKAITAFLEAVETQEVFDLQQGKPQLLHKLVAGKSNRQWADEKKAETLLSNHLKAEERRPPGDLISPAAAEKHLKGRKLSKRFENAFAALITKPEGKPTLVPVTDPRPALQFNPSEGLTVVPNVDDI